MSARHSFFAASRGPVTAVAAWLATSDERETSLPRGDQIGILWALAREQSARSLVALYEIATGVEWRAPSGPAREAMVRRVGQALESGAILLIPMWSIEDVSEDVIAGSEDRSTPEAMLASEVMEGRQGISFEGNRYHLVPGGVWARRRGQEKGSVVPLVEARRVVAGMKQRLADTPARRQLWEQVSNGLTDALGAEHGLLLLRAPSARVVPTPEAASEPAVTPSKARAVIAETQWIKIVAVYDDGTPYTGSAIVKLAGGRTVEGPLGEGGVFQVDGLDPGECEVAFPDLDARDVRYQG